MITLDEVIKNAEKFTKIISELPMELKFNYDLSEPEDDYFVIYDNSAPILKKLVTVKCNFCGNTSGLKDKRGGCISCGGFE